MLTLRPTNPQKVSSLDRVVRNAHYALVDEAESGPFSGSPCGRLSMGLACPCIADHVFLDTFELWMAKTSRARPMLPL